MSTFNNNNNNNNTHQDLPQQEHRHRLDGRHHHRRPRHPNRTGRRALVSVRLVLRERRQLKN